MIHLPTDIDYTKYSKTSGLNTRAWGKHGWYFLFSCIMGGYPVKIERNNTEHITIMNHFKNMFTSLGYTMPCIFCRESFKQFYKQIPIEPYLTGRIELMYWLYQIKNLVNQKLIAQEKERCDYEKSELKKKYYRGEISKPEYYSIRKQMDADIFVTTPTPPFKEVLEEFESLRAKCSKKVKSCIKVTKYF